MAKLPRMVHMRGAQPVKTFTQRSGFRALLWGLLVTVLEAVLAWLTALPAALPDEAKPWAIAAMPLINTFFGLLVEHVRNKSVAV